MADGMVRGKAQEPLFNRPPGDVTATKIDPTKDQHAAPPKKEEFKDVFQQHKEEASQIRSAGQNPAKVQAEAEEKIAQVNQALSGTQSYDLERELEDLKKITPDDMKLAEEMIFRGYAEVAVSMVNLPNVKFTIMSMTADEVALVDMVVFDYIKSKESKDGDTVDVPQSIVTSLKNNLLLLGLTVKGRDDKDMCDDAPTCRLELVKKAVRKAKFYEVTGEIDKYSKLLEEIKHAVRVRSARISEMATPLIDFLSDQKYQFELKMFRIMTAKQIIPKS